MAEKDIEVFVPAEALENIDLTVDASWLDEIMATELVTFLQEFNKITTGLRSARHVGDSRRIDDLTRTEAFLRTNIGYIQYKYPAVRAIANEVMAAQARQVKMGRSALGR
mgnify:CR=1 FL=1